MNSKLNFNEKPLVSICCATYNQAPYIRQCLEGFLMQNTTFPFEIIINDDASTDGTTEIIQDYEKKYPDVIKPIYQAVNQYSQKKKSMLFDILFPRAIGKYIAVCEGDDYWIDPLKLQKQVDFLESNEDYGTVYTNKVDYDEQQKLFTSPHLLVKEGNAYSEMLSGKVGIWTLTICFRKKLLDDALYHDLSSLPQGSFKGDLFLFYHITRVLKIKYLSDVTSVYRKLIHSASHFTDYKTGIKFSYSLRILGLYYLSKYPIADKCLSKFLSKKYTLDIHRYAVCFNDWDLNKKIHFSFSPIISFKFLLKTTLIYMITRNKTMFHLFSKIFNFYKKHL